MGTLREGPAHRMQFGMDENLRVVGRVATFVSSSGRTLRGAVVKRWTPLVALSIAQFVMVLDQSVMNVSISTLVEDFDTTVTTIQAVITLYCLVMAMFMLTGAKIGDIIGRRRAFVVGLVIYACGGAVTAVSQTVADAGPRLVGARGSRARRLVLPACRRL